MIIRPKPIFAFFTAIMLATGFHSNAFADDFYIGAGVYEVDSTISGFEDNDTVPAFFLGYTFIDSNFLMLAAELGKYDLGDYRNTNANASSDAYTLAAVVSLPVLSFIEIYAKAGTASVNLTVNGQNLDGTEVFIGAGFGFDILDTIDIYVEYLSFDTDIDTNLLGAGIRLDF
jgi:hypothetical protein